MTFDNSRTIINLRIKFFGITIIFLTYIALTYIGKIIKFPLFGMSDTVWTLILVVLYLFFAFLPMFLNYQYVYFSDEGENLVFRYYTSGMISGKKNSVEINKKTFSGFKTESRLFGLIQSIILYQQLKEGIAKYPPVYISALKREEKAKVFRSLSSFTSQL
jgi:hypothetical protein